MNRGSKRCREGMTRLVARRDDEGRGFVGQGQILPLDKENAKGTR